ncbi:MAG: hypothetical protein Kow0097_09200 [Candidatus Bipolaricaulota bacterium]|nr:GNAT family N-acetyltransferase [Candidatus Bipolaricaulota bacterium]
MILTTRRLTLIACPLDIGQTLLEDRKRAGELLGVPVPLGWPSRELAEVLAPYLQELLHDPQALGWGVWIAIHREANTIVGHAGFKGRPDRDGTVEIGYGIAPPHRGRGYATEAVEALCRWSFTHSEVRRVVAECAPDNAASIRVLEKSGFRPAGVSGSLLRWEQTRVESAGDGQAA